MDQTGRISYIREAGVRKGELLVFLTGWRMGLFVTTRRLHGERTVAPSGPRKAGILNIREGPVFNDQRGARVVQVLDALRSSWMFLFPFLL